MLSSCIALARAQNTDVQNDGGCLLLLYFVQDFSLDITDTINITLRQLYNLERMKKM